MSVHVLSDGARRVPHALLHYLRRQFEATVNFAVDAPRGIEVAQRMQAGVLRLVLVVDDASGAHRCNEHAHGVVVQGDAVTAHRRECQPLGM